MVVEAPRPGGRRILLVEDEPQLLPLLQRILTRGGYEVRGYADAESALEGFGEEWKPELLISDITLPGRSGVDLAVDLLLAEGALWCILTSGYAFDPGLLPAELQPRVRVLQKPFLPEALLREVGGVLGPAGG